MYISDRFKNIVSVIDKDSEDLLPLYEPYILKAVLIPGIILIVFRDNSIFLKMKYAMATFENIDHFMESVPKYYQVYPIEMEMLGKGMKKMNNDNFVDKRLLVLNSYEKDSVNI